MGDNLIYNNGMMNSLFGSHEDEYDRLYLGVYYNELKEIQKGLFFAKDVFTKSDMVTIVKYELYNCFGDGVNLNNEVCKKIVEEIYKID